MLPPVSFLYLPIVSLAFGRAIRYVFPPTSVPLCQILNISGPRRQKLLNIYIYIPIVINVIGRNCTNRG